MADSVYDVPGSALDSETFEIEATAGPSEGQSDLSTTFAIKILQASAREKQEIPYEIPHVLEDKAERSQLEVARRDAFQEDKDGGYLESRPHQAVLHLTFTEMRLRDVEDELRALKERLTDKPVENPRGIRKEVQLVYRYVLQRSSVHTFTLTTRSFDVPASERAALEVLVNVPATDVQSSDSDVLSENLMGSECNQTKSQPLQPIPERLRIRSRSLIHHLKQITQELFPEVPGYNMNSRAKDVVSSFVMLRPFKLFVVHGKRIKESFRDVEADMKEEAEKVAEIERQGRSCSINGKKFYHRDLYENLKLLIQFLDVDLQPLFDLRERLWATTITHIEFDDLWHLFSRGDIVITRSSRKHAYRVINFTGGRDLLSHRSGFSGYRERERRDANPRPLPTDGFTIDCWSLRHNGYDYVPFLERFSIRRFSGSQPIASLPVYPLRFDPDADEVRETFMAQGNRFLELTRTQYVHKTLTGRTLDEPSHEVNSQVIIDMALAINSKPEWRLSLTDRISEDKLTAVESRETREPSFCPHVDSGEGCCGSDIIFKDLEMDQRILSSYMRENGRLMGPRKAQDLEEDDLMLLPNWVYGFVLRSRHWVTMRTSDLSDVKFENDFSELILPEQHKKTIQALVETHEGVKLRQSGPTSVGVALDLVRGKGAGLIILLHGEPGVGKTSTAECVADNTRRPLFPITCGDIGETAVEVEGNLYHNFQLAQKWGCVLLLDEADVFLAKRNKTDLRRNAVTSVFLRSLEYYAGILFLTTNRVGGIDPAFKSRIHVSLYYQRLSLAATLKLYEVFIRRTRAEQDRSRSHLFRIKDRQIMHFAEKHYHQMEKEGLGTWNGRQIRNAFQTAIALTEHDSQNTEPGQPKPTLGKAQFRIVANGSREFDRYLVSTLGAAEADIAMREEWRADRFAVDNGAGSTAAAKPSPYRPPRVSLFGKKGAGSESEAESTEDEDDETSDEDDGNTVPTRSNKKSDKSQSTSTHKQTDHDEYEEFLKWKRNRSG